MKRFLALALALSFLAISAPRAEAQVSLGGQLAIADDVDFGIGANVGVPFTSVNENMEFNGAFTIFFPDFGNYFQIDADIRYYFPVSGNDAILPYALAGLGLGNFSWDEGVLEDDSNTELGVRLGGGVKFPMERVTPFVDLGLAVGDLPDFSLRGGVSFFLGS